MDFYTRGELDGLTGIAQLRLGQPEDAEFHVHRYLTALRPEQHGNRADYTAQAAMGQLLQGDAELACHTTGSVIPPDFAELLETIGLQLAPIGLPLRPVVKAVVTGTAPTAAEGLAQRTAALLASAYDAVAAAAEGCDAVVATGLIPAMAAARSVAEQLGIPYTSVACFPALPLAWPGLAWTLHQDPYIRRRARVHRLTARGDVAGAGPVGSGPCRPCAGVSS
ncbi:hypothetical protein ABZY81_34810 [Streptomyces sp. NPDC006514]|uniref:hypothetical protein n=1 Tax=Streptomyces sp. NPDC006514 TaxID=3154308 RepID=UPI0033BC8A0E